MKSLIATISAIGLLASSVAVAEYSRQSEINFSRNAADWESDNAEITINQLSHTYYLESLAADQGPLAEADFSQRISSFELSVSDAEYINTAADTRLTGIGYGAKVNMVPNNGDIYVGAFYTSLSVEDNDLEINEQHYGANAGYFVLPELAVGAIFQITDDEEFSNGNNTNDELQEAGIEAKYLAETIAGQYVNLEVSYITGEYDQAETETEQLDLAVDYYVNSTTNFRLASEQDLEANTETLEAGIRSYVTEALMLEISYSDDSADTDESDDSSVAFTVGLTF